MAVDTETKRRSVLGMTIMSLVVAPLADGSISTTDSMHITGFYSGISPQAGLATTALNIFSTGVVEPDHISDSGSNVLVAGDLETQGEGFFGRLTNESGRTVHTTRITGNTTLDTTHHVVYCDTDGGAFDVNLPAGSNGVYHRIINVGSAGNDVTVIPDGAELLTGANASRTLSDSSVIILTYETTEGWW